MGVWDRLRRPRPVVPGEPGAYHGVLLYEDDEQLLRTLEAYVLEGAGWGVTTVCIATAEHLAALRGRLAAQGRQTAMLGVDADGLLDQILREGLPDRVLFDRHVSSFVAAGVDASVQFFGEMVSLLWRRGDVVAAVALEDLWAAFQRRVPVPLLCAYAESDFRDARERATACRRHNHVVPAVA